MTISSRLACHSVLLLVITAAHIATAAPDEPAHWLPATAFAVPEETAPEGEGYFAIVEGHNGRLYVGTHANALNSWLVEFDPKAEQMKIAVDAMKAIGYQAAGFVAQAKIHSRNNVGKSGNIYFATKQGYPAKDESRLEYPGGYPMTYDPATDTTTVYPIAVPHEGIISIAPDESRNLFYISTCSDSRPFDHAHFMVYDMTAEKYTDLIDSEHMYAFIVVDNRGRAYHPLRGGDIARYDPDTKTLTRLKQTIDGNPPDADSHLADENAHPINWDITPDGKTIFAVPMSGNALYAYDLNVDGDTLAGRTVGTLIPNADNFDCRAMCVGPTGTVWAAVTHRVSAQLEGGKEQKIAALHLVRFQPGKDTQPVDLGQMYVTNPDFTQWSLPDGKPNPVHRGFASLDNGKLVSQYVTMGVCEARDGAVYVLALCPYSLLRVDAQHLSH